MEQENNMTLRDADPALLPRDYNYTAEAFLTPEPYEKVYELFSSPFLYQQARISLEQNAAVVGFKSFKSMMSKFEKAKEAERKQTKRLIPNQTEFDGQAMELSCGDWEATDWGISRPTIQGGREIACAHPIAPIQRLVNIDTGEVKVRLAYKRSGSEKKWNTTIVSKDTISTARSITALASMGISVTSTTAKALVDYLNEVENANYDIIPESRSIGRLGYIPGEGFAPYVEGLVFDGDASFRNLYGCVSSRGSLNAWMDVALECRKMSVTARILLAASFASPILSIVGSLPFFVHLWGVDSGTGKTVGLMLAASVWGNPALGAYTQTFNATQVGQERTAAFLNHLPLCIDELQLTRDSRGKSSFDVYQLAQGVGRARGRKNGGVEMTPTWSLCMLTTGESPITAGNAGAGAVNRVIDIECTAGEPVITNGRRISGILKGNYGFAGEIFVRRLYESEGVQDQIREIYQDCYQELCRGDSTEKQAMAAAAILTADILATHWIFGDDGRELTAEEIRSFLASREAVSAGKRAYDWLCDWVSSNVFHFNSDDVAASGELYGLLEGDTVYIIRGVFDRVIQEAGFSTAATLSYLRANRLIETRPGKGYTKTKRIGKTVPQCVWLRLSGCTEETDLLPL